MKYIHADAEFSECGTYRFSLERDWDRNRPLACWICLNPSDAGKDRDDPTVRKIVGFSDRLGFGGMRLFNVFPLIATNPRMLLDTNPVHSQNTPEEIHRRCSSLTSYPPIFAWGAVDKRLYGYTARMADQFGRIAGCLGFTKSGQPRHPLMLPYSTPLKSFDLAASLVLPLPRPLLPVPQQSNYRSS